MDLDRLLEGDWLYYTLCVATYNKLAEIKIRRRRLEQL